MMKRVLQMHIIGGAMAVSGYRMYATCMVRVPDPTDIVSETPFLCNTTEDGRKITLW